MFALRDEHKEYKMYKLCVSPRVLFVLRVCVVWCTYKFGNFAAVYTSSGAI